MGNLQTTTHGYYPTSTYSTNENNSNNKSIRPPIKLPPKWIWQGYPGKLVALARNKPIELLQLTNPEKGNKPRLKPVLITTSEHFNNSHNKSRQTTSTTLELVVMMAWHTIKLTHQDPTSSSPSGSVLNEDGMSGTPAIPQLLTFVSVLTSSSTQNSILQSSHNNQHKLSLRERPRATWSLLANNDCKSIHKVNSNINQVYTSPYLPLQKSRIEPHQYQTNKYHLYIWEKQNLKLGTSYFDQPHKIRFPTNDASPHPPLGYIMTYQHTQSRPHPTPKRSHQHTNMTNQTMTDQHKN